MFQICAVLAIEFLEHREADESIAKPRSTTEFWEGDVRGHEKVPACGQVEVLAGGQLKVPTPRSPCRPGV